MYLALKLFYFRVQSHPSRPIVSTEALTKHRNLVLEQKKVGAIW